MLHIMHLIKLTALFLLLSVTAVQADVPMPEISKGQGDACVRPTLDMRYNHMDYIQHQRDETMHRGIRTEKDSLKRCVTCHAVKDDKGEYVHVTDDRHFCSSCHNYAAVSIDCFQCHTDTPRKTDRHEPLAQGH